MSTGTVTVKRGRGRPKGSKNKPKTETTPYQVNKVLANMFESGLTVKGAQRKLAEVISKKRTAETNVRRQIETLLWLGLSTEDIVAGVARQKRK